MITEITGRNNLFIYGRIRPLSNVELECINNQESRIYKASSYYLINEYECLKISEGNDKIIELYPPNDEEIKDREPISFELHGSINSDVKSIYDHLSIGNSLIQNSLILNGSSTFIAYGQTGSGKTYSSLDIIKYVGENLLEKRLTFELSVYELKNEKCFDLINVNNKTALSIYESNSGKILINASSVNIVDKIHLNEVLNESFSNRTTKATSANNSSSRSHCFYRYHIKNTEGQVYKFYSFPTYKCNDISGCNIIVSNEI